MKMLVLSRKTGQWLQIGQQIRMVVVRIERDRVRVGIEAPENVRIARGELETVRVRSARHRPGFSPTSCRTQ
jgi:carbon storage regulator